MVYRTSSGRIVHERTALMEIKVTYEDGEGELVPVRAVSIANAIRTAQTDDPDHGCVENATFVRYIEGYEERI